MGLNEVKLGLPVPYLPAIILQRILPERAATEIVSQGGFLMPDRSLTFGLVDQMHPPEKVEEAALSQMIEMAALPGPAYAAIKATRIEEVVARYQAHREVKLQEMLDMWFTPPAQRLLHQAAEKF
jgi:enoyl-CoA hydratase/carnithine racemase